MRAFDVEACCGCGLQPDPGQRVFLRQNAGKRDDAPTFLTAVNGEVNSPPLELHLISAPTRPNDIDPDRVSVVNYDLQIEYLRVRIAARLQWTLVRFKQADHLTVGEEAPSHVDGRGVERRTPIVENVLGIR